MQTDILIVGAGASGLHLANALSRQGRDWCLVEARSRCGGRILTRRSDTTGPEQWFADAGPSWLWPGQPRIAGLLQHYQLPAFEQYSQGLLIYEDEAGDIRRDLDYATMAGALRIDGGLDRLIEALAGSLPADRVLLSQRVRAVHAQDGGFRVDLAQDGVHREILARRVVLALPPRVIAQTIDFEPALPQAALDDLRGIPTWMAGHAKFFAIYARPFWRESGYSGDAISRLGPLMEIHDASPMDARFGALFGFVGLPAGAPGRSRERMDHDAIAQLTRLFGEAASTPVDTLLQDWSDDVHTATPADRVNQAHPRYYLPSSLAALASKGLLFASTEVAGEHGGLIEGAFEAAEQALAWLEQHPSNASGSG